jgi:hypothetical protein
MRARRPIPGRVRTREAEEKKRLLKESDKWYKKSWPWITATCGLLGWILLNNITVLKNLEELPTAYEKTRNTLQTRYYDDASWTGIWSTKAEGYVDMGDEVLSSTDVRLEMASERGDVNGMVATPELCKSLPFATGGVLFRGRVTRDGIEGIAYDHIGGKEVKIASLSIVPASTSKGTLLITVFAKDDELKAFPSAAKILLHPESRSNNTSPDLTPYCDEYVKPKKYDPKDKIRRPVEQLHYSRTGEKQEPKAAETN